MAELTFKRLVGRTSVVLSRSMHPRVLDNQPLTLTYRGLPISLAIKYNLKMGYQACLTVTRPYHRCPLLYLILEKYQGSCTLILSERPFGRRPLRFVSKAELGDNLFRYETIFLARSSKHSGVVASSINDLHGAKQLVPASLAVCIDGNCVVLDSFPLWQGNIAQPNSLLRN